MQVDYRATVTVKKRPEKTTTFEIFKQTSQIMQCR